MSKNQTILHYKSASPVSSTDTTDALAPTAANLNYGEIAINYLADDPTIYIKDSKGVVREFKGKDYIVSLYNALKGGTLPTTSGYTNLAEVATTLYNFINGVTDSNGVIDKWKEVEAFLNTYTDGTTLANLLAAKADKTTKVIAGNGLTGGGDLSANRTLAVNPADDSVVVGSGGVKANTVDDDTTSSSTRPVSSKRHATLYSQVQTFIANFQKFFTLSGSGTTADPYVIKFNGNAYATGGLSALGQNADGTSGSGVSAFADCTDVTLGVLSDGDIIYYDKTSSHWMNRAGTYYCTKAQYDGLTTTVGGLSDALTALTTKVSALNIVSGIKVGSTTVPASGNSDVLTLIAGSSYITLTPDATNKAITFTVSIPEVTQSADGLMIAADKKKLDGVAAGANNYTHPNSGVAAGTYCNVTVNTQGHVTAGTNIVDGGTF